MQNEKNNNPEVRQAVTEALQSEKKRRKKKKWLIIGAVFLVFIIIGAAFSSGDEEKNKHPVDPIKNTQNAGEEQQENNDQTTEKEEPKEQKIETGNAVTTDDFKIYYLSCNTDFKKYQNFIKPNTGNKIISAEFEYENVSSSDRTIPFMECYADNRKCERFYGVNDASYNSLSSISPGRNLKEVVYFEVPKDSKDIEIEIELNIWTEEKIVFVVK